MSEAILPPAQEARLGDPGQQSLGQVPQWGDLLAPQLCERLISWAGVGA